MIPKMKFKRAFRFFINKKIIIPRIANAAYNLVNSEREAIIPLKKYFSL